MPRRDQITTLPACIFYALQREKMLHVERADEGIRLYRMSLPLGGEKTLGYVAHIFNEATETARFIWFDGAGLLVAVQFYMIESANFHHKWRTAPQHNKEEEEMHEPNRYHLSQSDELLVDCVGGPMNVKIQTGLLTPEEAAIREKLLAEKHGTPATPAAAPDPDGDKENEGEIVPPDTEPEKAPGAQEPGEYKGEQAAETGPATDEQPDPLDPPPVEEPEQPDDEDKNPKPESEE